ncbi:MAG: gamma-glutamylcyclotransferase family protein [Pseudomonadota bacterium]
MTDELTLPENWFFFGSLLDADVRAVVIGRPVPDRDCAAVVLDGYRRVRVVDESYPALVASPGDSVDGILVSGLSAEEALRILWFEGEEYQPEAVQVRFERGGFDEAYTFLAAPDLGLTAEPWDYAAWANDALPDYVSMTAEWMDGYGENDFAAQDAIWRAAQDAPRTP